MVKKEPHDMVKKEGMRPSDRDREKREAVWQWANSTGRGHINPHYSLRRYLFKNLVSAFL